MNTDFSKTKIYHSFTHILYLVFFSSLIFSVRGITSISLGLMLLLGIMSGKQAVRDLFQKRTSNFFLAGCIILFLLQLMALVYTNDKQQGWTDIRIKAGLAITPLTIHFFSYYRHDRQKLFFHYCLLLAIASLYCLCISFLNFRETGLVSYFFYHQLASPVNQHAVYFSVLIAIGLIFLLDSLPEKNFLFSRLFHICAVIYLSAFLFLLSSKLVITFYILYLAYYFISLFKKTRPGRLVITVAFALCIIAIGLLFAVRNPISERFNDILKGNINIVRQESFNEGVYFNGLQFRLLQWRFVAEILNENKRWWLGVSPGDAQSFLNKKYLAKHMYAGDPSRRDGGYLIYNTHNQFLETLLQSGIIGLAILIAICFFTLKIAVQGKNQVAIPIALLLIIWLFTESVFETQYGIIIFTFFPLFICSGMDQLQAPAKANLLKTNSDI